MARAQTPEAISLAQVINGETIYQGVVLAGAAL